MRWEELKKGSGDTSRLDVYMYIFKGRISVWAETTGEMVGTEVNMPNNKQNEFPAKNTHTNMLDMWFWNVPIEFHLQPHVACWPHFVVGCRKSWSYHHCISICGCGLMWLNKRKLCLSSSSSSPSSSPSSPSLNQRSGLLWTSSNQMFDGSRPRVADIQWPMKLNPPSSDPDPWSLVFCCLYFDGEPPINCLLFDSIQIPNKSN